MRNTTILIFLLILVLAAAVFCVGCGEGGQSSPAVTRPTGSSVGAPMVPNAAVGKELMALVESEAEAEEIAKLYGIALVDCAENVACFHTEENLYDVIARGKENGWPLLEINHVITLDDPVDMRSFSRPDAASQQKPTD